MAALDYVWAGLLVVIGLAGWVLNVVGLPGNWIVGAACLTYAQFGPARGRLDIGWGVVISVLVLALLGELVELIAAAWGTQQAGGSKRGAALALAGSILGGIVGMFAGFPIPVAGPVVGAVLCGGIGALLGAMLGEQWKGRGWDDSMRVGTAAFWGRLFGTLGKSLAGAVMLVVIAAALVV